MVSGQKSEQLLWMMGRLTKAWSAKVEDKPSLCNHSRLKLFRAFFPNEST